MKKIGLMTLVLLMIVLPLRSVSARGDVVIPGCDLAAQRIFQDEFLPLFEDYAQLREAFIANGDIGRTGGELIALREALETAVADSPACLQGLSLQLVLSVSNFQTAILFLILSVEIDDPPLSESLGQISSHYAQRSDAQFAQAAETIEGWGIAPLAIIDRPADAT